MSKPWVRSLAPRAYTGSLRAKYIRDLVIRGPVKKRTLEEAYKRYVRYLAQYYAVRQS
jgi:hypothetical protein